MKKIFTLVLFMICVYGVAAQPYLTGKRSITFTDNNRSGRLVPTDIYYPANVSEIMLP